jgi:hypothetical protein
LFGAHRFAGSSFHRLPMARFSPTETAIGTFALELRLLICALGAKPRAGLLPIRARGIKSAFT